MKAIARYSDEEVGFLQTFNIHRDNYTAGKRGEDRSTDASERSEGIEECAGYIMSRRLARIAAELLGADESEGDRVRLYQSCVFVKPPGFGETNWHSDANMVPLDTNRFVTLWLPLRPLQEDDAALVFASGSHRDFALPYWHTLEGMEDLESRGEFNPYFVFRTDPLRAILLTTRRVVRRIRHRIVRTLGPRRFDRARGVVPALVAAAARGRATAARAERVLLLGRRQAVDGEGRAPEAGAARGGRVELRGLARRRQGWGGGEAPGVAGGVPLSRRDGNVNRYLCGASCRGRVLVIM